MLNFAATTPHQYNTACVCAHTGVPVDKYLLLRCIVHRTCHRDSMPRNSNS